MEKDSRIYVAGHTGMVGSAIVRCLERNGYHNIIKRTHKELDLTDQAECEKFFRQEKPEYVFLAAAKVGGIHANNTYPADFITENLLIECNVIQSAFKNNVKKLMFLGSSCIYPKLCPQPIKEEYLLTGPLEPTNEAYAIAKIAGIKMCQSYNKQYGTRYISVMPANLYGINDRFDENNSHVIPAMIIKFHKAKTEKLPFVELWGTGKPLREFLYVDDMAEACIYLMQHYDGSDPVNIGSGQEISIRELAEIIRDVVGYTGEVVFDATKPDGTPRRILDNSKITAMGWKPKTDIREGIKMEYEYYLNMIQKK
ncbi:NAD-dependent epimerase/dehydratase [Thermoclostridium stercorarium subsp. stercorarium DSM 8532]|jgi:GDP-L-fucose synthase|uniref:GDP-L-fucose synthase n=3 Tax=Thermoclostridium stercorarium TaxID=1510 RepID=L7VP47_THES1|nr:GDP-L-fucose synthase [Thermoclostridium stercorarium]AGC68552.1 NAD-dependent epimerase/dehydratase [Thermoclostridium stercorarium subsp. stercorarium DSM 8532]AGI39568.1 nucleoside-diphosphate-sugar epimerase [Thermoclostridium stercorarium subsp. stercorarium DSM 8532]ANW98902.1 GDP-fucose synthetase [Thermoclostridium stercorarium subsp. thermolacticum DSM 2910]ANX01429.1 GDP-fucose synthetase [Thermoclostridium stercorarium subsp. leptospartum DSM 9219]